VWPSVAEGYGLLVVPTLPLTIVVFTVVTTIVLLVLALAVPAPAPDDVPEGLEGLEGLEREHDHRRGPGEDRRPRIRLLSQVLFTRRQRDNITIDCLLVSVEQAGPGVGAPAGLPFTLQFRTPDTAWFADRVEHLLNEWSAENRELLVELREDHGKVRTVLTSGPSAVHLELAGAAGLSLTS
jgi:hypothetical protein